MALCDRPYMHASPDTKAIARAETSIQAAREKSLPSVEGAWVGEDGTIRLTVRIAARADDPGTTGCLPRLVPVRPPRLTPGLLAAAPAPD